MPVMYPPELATTVYYGSDVLLVLGLASAVQSLERIRSARNKRESCCIGTYRATVEGT